MKLNEKAADIIMPLMLSLLMTFVISLVSSLASLGFADFTFNGWLSAWGLSWLIAFPTLLVVLPMVRKFTKNIIQWTDK